VTSGVSQTKAQAAVMAKSAANFEQVNDSLQQMLTNLMNELEVLRQSWQGAGGRSFEQVKAQWARDQKAMSTALSQTATAIRRSGASYESSDSDASQRVAASNRGLTLPL
jgi:WXG100 family type VII secretion target